MEQPTPTSVTLAIHTRERAEEVRTLLSTEGIDAWLESVSPDGAGEWRVKILRDDLTRALTLVEQKRDNLVKKSEHGILIPVDFSDHALRAGVFGFKLARAMRRDVVLLHCYIGTSGFGDTWLGSDIIGGFVGGSSEQSRRQVALEARAQADMEAFLRRLLAALGDDAGSVKYTCRIAEGVPEEEILRVAELEAPAYMVMGTRGKSRKTQDVIGSVTAEVIERSRIPVFVIPERAEIKDFGAVRNIAYTTNFGQRDMVAFERVIQYLKPFSYKISFLHIQQRSDMWDEIKMSGIKEYFKTHHPGVEMAYYLEPEGRELVETLEDFVRSHDIDLLTLNAHKRNVLARLFYPSLSQKMVFEAEVPMLVFHG